jgi:hypothetical protein
VLGQDHIYSISVDISGRSHGKRQALVTVDEEAIVSSKGGIGCLECYCD